MQIQKIKTVALLFGLITLAVLVHPLKNADAGDYELQFVNNSNVEVKRVWMMFFKPNVPPPMVTTSIGCSIPPGGSKTFTLSSSDTCDHLGAGVAFKHQSNPLRASEKDVSDSCKTPIIVTILENTKIEFNN